MVEALSPGAIGAPGIALSFAFVVAAMVFAFGSLSGAHINPAVTLAFASVRRFPLRGVPAYIAAQCVGAAAAAATLRTLLGAAGQIGATVPSRALDISAADAFVLECLMSFALMLVIMAVATDERVTHGFSALAVGTTVGFCALVGGPLTGASMNPARSFGPALAGGIWTGHWLYWIAPILSMMLAAHVYDWLHPAYGSPLAVASGVEGPLG